MTDPFENFDQQELSFTLLERHRDELVVWAQKALAADPDAQPAALILTPDSDLAGLAGETLTKAAAQGVSPPPVADDGAMVLHTNYRSVASLLQAQAPLMLDHLPPPLRGKVRLLPILCATRTGFRLHCAGYEAPVWDEDFPDYVQVPTVVVGAGLRQVPYYMALPVGEHLFEDAGELERDHPGLSAVGIVLEPDAVDADDMRKLAEEQTGERLANKGFYGAVPRQHALDMIRRREPAALDWLESAGEGDGGERRLPLLVATARGYRLGVLVWTP